MGISVPNISREFILTVVATVFCWEFLKWVFRWKTAFKAEVAQEESSIDVGDYPELVIPEHPHMEMATDPPTGLKCSNAMISFDNEYAAGSYLFMLPPRGSGGDQTFANYFKGKSRIWELRLQLRFKKPPSPDAELFFGVELDQYVEMNSATKFAQDTIVKTLRAIAGGVYQSVGDNPKTTSGEIEKPSCVFPLWAFDQVIATPQGKDPPNLTDANFGELGIKRSKRVSEFVKELDDLKKKITSTSTYTFAFWGISKNLDVVGWNMIGIPLITPLDFDKFAGKPPVFVSVYCLRPDETGGKDGRHINSRKQYFFRTSAWSSLRRPEKDRFEALSGSNMASNAFGPSKSYKKTLRRRFGSMVNATFATCYTRPKES